MTAIAVSLPKPHAGQERIDAALGEYRYVVVMCGRRWGKTKYGIGRAARLALDGKRVAWFAPTYKYAQEAWREITSRIRPACKVVSEQEKRLETLNGGVIELWTLDTPDPARGRFYDEAIIDEAGVVRDLEGVFWQAIRPTLTDRRGRALFLGTPKGRSHGFSVFFAKGETGEKGWWSIRAATKENPFIPADEIEEARQTMPAGAFAQEYEGIPADDGANPFGLDAIASVCTLDGLSSHPPVAWGWDFARAQDWTVGLALDRFGHVTGLHRWQAKPWEFTQRETVRIVGSVTAYGDSTGVGDAVVEGIQRLGCPMVGVKFSGPEKQRLMERLSVAIQSRAIALPKDGWLRAELEAFTYEYTATGVRYTAPNGLHDDGVMALALAVRGYDLHPDKGRPYPQRPSSRQDDQFPGFTAGGHRKDEFVADEDANVPVRIHLPRTGSRGTWS